MPYIAQPSKSPLGFPQGHTNAAGVWERNGGETFALKLPIDYTLADAAVLYTVPAGLRVRVVSVFWEVTTGFSGGSSSAIGLSSSQSPHDAKGDIHGGSAGDVTAILGSTGVVRGTQGLSFTATPFVVVLDGGATIKYDRVTSVYTAGVGSVHLELRVVG
jgi:hypothetical protein